MHLVLVHTAQLHQAPAQLLPLAQVPGALELGV